MSAVQSRLRCMIVPGNGGGGGDIARCNWYGWARDALVASGLFEDGVVLENMPDPMTARESVWLPHIIMRLGDGRGGRDDAGIEHDDAAAVQHSVVVGHSSGAEAALRLAEKQPLRGIVLVSACHTDLGNANEAASGYYPQGDDHPWDWAAIRANCGFIVQFHSDDDPFIPLAEARHVAEHAQTDYRELSGRSHFFSPPFPELVACLQEKLAGGGDLNDA